MGNFKPVATLAVKHNFFDDGVCKNLIFSPTPISQKLIQQYQLLIKATDDGFTLIANQELGFTPDDNIVLRFDVSSTDNYFAFYTSELENREKPLFYSATSGSTPVILPSEFYTPDALQGDKPPRFNSSAKPGFTIDIHIAASDFIAASVIKHYVIELHARALFWKYYFFGELAKLDLSIHDLNSQSSVNFELCEEPIVKNGKAFMSQTPIVMCNVPTQRFQLKDNNSFGKVLVKRLPNAGIQLVGKGRDSSGQSVLVAEIYINQ